MTDKNRITRRDRTIGINSIKPVQIFDLTGGDAQTIILKSKRTITNPDLNSEALNLRRESQRSPWRDDKRGVDFANRSLTRRSGKDPVQELKKFLDNVTRN